MALQSGGVTSVLGKRKIGDDGPPPDPDTSDDEMAIYEQGGESEEDEDEDDRDPPRERGQYLTPRRKFHRGLYGVLTQHSVRVTKEYFRVNAEHIKSRSASCTVFYTVARISAFDGEVKYAKYWMSILRHLVALGAPMVSAPCESHEALYLVCRAKHLRMVLRELVDACIAQNFLSELRSAFIAALSDADVDAINTFISAGAHRVDGEFCFLDHLPVKKLGLVSVRAWLSRCGLQTDGSFYLNQIRADNVDVVRELHVMGYRHSSHDEKRTVPLTLATSTDMVAVLMGPENADRDYWRSLSPSCESRPLNHVETRNRDVVTALLDAGVTASQFCTHECTALDAAVVRKDCAFAKRLIDANAYVSIGLLPFDRLPFVVSMAAMCESSSMHRYIQQVVNDAFTRSVLGVRTDLHYSITPAQIDIIIRHGILPHYEAPGSEGKNGGPVVSGAYVPQCFLKTVAAVTTLVGRVRCEMAMAVSSARCIRDLLPSDCIEIIISALCPRVHTTVQP